MTDNLRNIADVIDHINELDNVYVIKTEHEGKPDDYGTFTLTIEVPQYERLDAKD